MKCSLSRLVFSRSFPLILVSGIALTGCGAGSKVIRDLKLDATTENNQVLVEMQATLMQAQFTLPSVVLPLIDPKRPERKLGELETRANQIFVRVNATEAARFPLIDGTKLPNGTGIPVNLNGLTPVGIPVGGSNSVVYLASGNHQLMIGAAVTIKKDDNNKSPFNIFLPVQIHPEIVGNGGMFFGSRQGIGVFALRTKLQTDPVLPGRVAKSLAVQVSQMEVSPEPVTNTKLRRMDRAIGGLHGVVQLD